MAVDTTKARSAVTGAVSKGLTSATAPTGTASALTGFTDLGAIGEDGVTRTLPEGGDREIKRMWQNGAQVRVFRSPTDDLPTFTMVFLETKKEVVETYFGVTVTQTVTEGSFEYDASTLRTASSYVLDVVDGAELTRVYIPQGVVASVGDQVFQNGEVIGYEVTIEAEKPSALAFNFKEWQTALKS